MAIAIYPGTFDPITPGRVDVAERASRLFDRLVVAVAIGRHKAPERSLDQRLALVREALAHLPNVEVEGFDGLVVDFAAARGASVLVRGLRGARDVGDELAMVVTNRRIAAGIQTMFLAASEDLGHVSSTVVRALARS
ncbi:MAG: pantetheine-phosphate adenylyltransferase [Candidatus Rokubacteria bacterium]|nr:pantetheine-phosphate adenylyltransferase [Candidatus Rokubacteria bacterium]